MKNLKKLGAIVLALVMVLSLSVTAFADGAYNGDQVFADTDTFTKFPVIVEIDNTNAKTGNGATTFTYTLSSGAAVPVSTDAGGNKVQVYAGPAGAKLNTSALDTAVTLTFDKNLEGDALKQTLTVDLGSVTFPNAGIFRYTLTQSAFTQEQKDIGFQNESANGKDAVVKYIDVYVKNVATTPGATDYKVANTVVSNALPAVLTVNADSEVDYSTYVKTDRFVNTFGADLKPDPDDPNPPDPDHPRTTTNVITIEKHVTGNMGDKNYQFPFNLTVSYTDDTTDAATTLEGVKFSVEAADGAVVTAPADGWVVKEGAYTGLITMKDGGKVTITVPNSVNVLVQEAIEDTLGYTVSTEVKDASFQTIATAQAESENKRTDVAGLGGLIKNSEKDNPIELSWTNKLDAISPTGVVMRFAPYFFMMGAAIILVLFTRRREEEQA